jgi:hypothetical protein
MNDLWSNLQLRENQSEKCGKSGELVACVVVIEGKWEAGGRVQRSIIPVPADFGTQKEVRVGTVVQTER